MDRDSGRELAGRQGRSYTCGPGDRIRRDSALEGVRSPVANRKRDPRNAKSVGTLRAAPSEPDKRQGNRPLTRFMQPSWWCLGSALLSQARQYKSVCETKHCPGITLENRGAILIYLWSVACIFATGDLIADISAGDVIIPEGDLFA
jgi:hypothetical protein